VVIFVFLLFVMVLFVLLLFFMVLFVLLLFVMVLFVLLLFVISNCRATSDEIVSKSDIVLIVVSD
jgi:hypothetical protein